MTRGRGDDEAPGGGNEAPARPAAVASLPSIRFGQATDPGRRRLANEDAAAVDARRGWFVVCDGIGGQPSGEAASNLACRALGHLLFGRIRTLPALDHRILKQLLIECAEAVGAEIQRLSGTSEALSGMGCTLVATLVDARVAFLVHAGDSRAYLLRDGVLRQLTEDHTRVIQRNLVPGFADDGEGERRLLTQYLGSSKPLSPDASVVPLEAGDRLLLCTDGLTDPLDDQSLAVLLQSETDPEAACAALVKAANQAGGPDNVTTVVIDYAGPRPVTEADRRWPPRTAEQPPAGVTTRFHDALLAVEVELEALAADAASVLAEDPCAALAALRRSLGEPLYRERLEADESLADRPAVAFHSARGHPDSAWRRAYQGHLDRLAPPLELITSGSVRLSPLLPGDDTAELYRRLWHQWQAVERRYFHACRPDAPAPGVDPVVAGMLTRHMFQAVRTMRELLVFLPQFLRNPPSAG